MKTTNKGLFFFDFSFFIKKKTFLMLILTSIIVLVSISMHMKLLGCEKFEFNDVSNKTYFTNSSETNFYSRDPIESGLKLFIFLAFDENETFNYNDEDRSQKFIEPKLLKVYVLKNIVTSLNSLGTNAFSMMRTDTFNGFTDLSVGEFYFRC